MSYNSGLLDGVAVFTAVVESGGFTAAAKRLGHTPSYVSKEITKLEGRLGARLLNRSTRSISLTDEGRAYFERCRSIVETAQEAESEATRGQAAPSGTLRVAAPVSFGLSHLRRILPSFIERYPDVVIDIEFNERMIDLVGEGIDVAIRIGRLQDSALVARKLGDFRGVVVAAPSYWKKHGRPQRPDDLKSHKCISYSYMADPSVWEFTADGEKIRVGVELSAKCNSAELEVAFAVAGAGVTRLPFFVCEKEVAAGKLEIVLEEFEQEPMGLYAVFPHRLYTPAKVRCFVDFLEGCLSNDA